MGETDWKASVLPWLLAVTLGLALLPYGSVTSGAQATAEVLVALLFFVVAARAAMRSADTSPSPIARLLEGLPPSKVLALPLLLIAQLAVQKTVGLSVGPTVGIERSFAYVATATAFFLLVHGASRQPRGMTTLLIGLIAIGAAEAGYAVLNLLSGNETVVLSKRIHYLDAATGTLISKNHFAYLMEMMLPVSAGCVASMRLAIATDRRPHDQRGPQSIVLAVVTALTATALLLSASRMGIVSLVVSTLIVLAMTPRLRSAPEVQQRLRWTFAAGAALASVYALAIGVDRTFARVGLIWTDFIDGRLPIWSATWTMFTAKPIFGHGWGTFVDIYPAFKLAPTGLYSPHAHNEYLQVASESGVVGIIVVGVLVGSFLYGLRAKLAAPVSEIDRPIRVGLAIAILSVLIHSGTDFGLRIPGVGLAFAYVVALYCSDATMSAHGATKATESTRHRSTHVRRRRRTTSGESRSTRSQRSARSGRSK